MNIEQANTLRPEITFDPPARFAIGTVLQDTYRIVRPLAEGGCGEVYVAAHTRLPGEFAVKVLHSSLARDREQLARFRQEAEITSTLRHPHIVQVFDFNVTDDGVPYLVMELLEGESLVELASASTPIDPKRVAGIIEQIAARASRRARTWRRAPRSEARQRHAALAEWHAGLREGAGLRNLAGELAAAPDPGRRPRLGHAPVHGAGTSAW